MQCPVLSIGAPPSLLTGPGALFSSKRWDVRVGSHHLGNREAMGTCCLAGGNGTFTPDGRKDICSGDSTPPCPTISFCAGKQSQGLDRRPHSRLAGQQAPPGPTKNHWHPCLPATPVSARGTPCASKGHWAVPTMGTDTVGAGGVAAQPLPQSGSSQG